MMKAGKFPYPARHRMEIYHPKNITKIDFRFERSRNQIVFFCQLSARLSLLSASFQYSHQKEKEAYFERKQRAKRTCKVGQMSLKVCWCPFVLLGVAGGCFAIISWLFIFGAKIEFLYLLKGHKISEGLFHQFTSPKTCKFERGRQFCIHFQAK